MKRASTVIALCDSRILLVKRKPTARFMPSRTVFPGGVEEVADTAFDGSGACAAGPRKLESDQSSHTHACTAPAQVAALRELFEEAGILITRPRVAHIAAGMVVVVSV